LDFREVRPDIPCSYFSVIRSRGRHSQSAETCPGLSEHRALPRDHHSLTRSLTQPRERTSYLAESDLCSSSRSYGGLDSQHCKFLSLPSQPVSHGQIPVLSGVEASSICNVRVDLQACLVPFVALACALFWMEWAKDLDLAIVGEGFSKSMGFLFSAQNLLLWAAMDRLTGACYAHWSIACGLHLRMLMS
jgi:hypothetical protein